MLYSANVCIQIADYLNIYIFRVDKPPPTPYMMQHVTTRREQQSSGEGTGGGLSNLNTRSSHYQRSKWGAH